MTHPQTTQPVYEQVVLQPGRDKPVRQRHPWVFSGAIQQIPAAARDGDVVAVVDSRGQWLASGYLNRASQIRVRLLTWDAAEIIDEGFWRRRLAAAIARRQTLAAEATTAYRLVNAESDFLPGLTVDRYGDYLVLQAGTLGIDLRKPQLAALLLELTGCRGVVERSDAGARREEGLAAAGGLLAGAAPPTTLDIQEHGLRFRVDPWQGQKTGFYTDQRANRARVAAYCRGQRVLNGFSYTGAFAVHALAGGAAHVCNVDSSADALVLGEENLRLNGFDPDGQAESIAGDLFQILRDWRTQVDGRDQFGIVILDPPKFATNKRSVERALRGYKDINLLALQLVAANGILATFSCSGLVSLDLFQKVVFAAATDAGREVQILEWLHQGPDHPVAISFPEGEYLKGLLCRVL